MPPRDMSGAISRNDRKEQDKHPDFKGDCMVNGQEYWLSAWIKEGKGKDGKPRKFFSLAFTAKEDKPQQRSGGGGKPSYPQRGRVEDDDIPFAWAAAFLLGAALLPLLGALPSC